MQDRNAFNPNNNVGFEVHSQLTPDCNILSCPKFSIGHLGFPMKMGIQFLIVPCLRRDKSGFQLKDCGNDGLNMSLLMPRLG